MPNTPILSRRYAIVWELCVRKKKLNKFTRNSKIEIIIAVYFAFKSLFQPNIISFELEVKLFIFNMSQFTKIPNKNKDCADISKSPLQEMEKKLIKMSSE